VATQCSSASSSEYDAAIDGRRTVRSEWCIYARLPLVGTGGVTIQVEIFRAAERWPAVFRLVTAENAGPGRWVSLPAECLGCARRKVGRGERLGLRAVGRWCRVGQQALRTYRLPYQAASLPVVCIVAAQAKTRRGTAFGGGALQAIGLYGKHFPPSQPLYPLTAQSNVSLVPALQNVSCVCKQVSTATEGSHDVPRAHRGSPASSTRQVKLGS